LKGNGETAVVIVFSGRTTKCLTTVFINRWSAA